MAALVLMPARDVARGTRCSSRKVEWVNVAMVMGSWEEDDL